MTRPLFDQAYGGRPQQRQLHCCGREAPRLTPAKAPGGPYSTGFLGAHGALATGLGPHKKGAPSERRNSHASQCPPVSNSHLLALNLGEPNICKDSRSIFDGLVGAIERHILHSDPSGNVKIPSSLLHVGECPEVPEHLATFALRRSGSLHFRQPQEEELTADEPQEKGLKQKGALGQHSMSEPKLASCCKAPPLKTSSSRCSDLQTSAGSSGSLTSAGSTPRAGGLRRTFSWHRIRDKLRR